MANMLKNLMINRADLVDAPSNPLARVVLYKRASAIDKNLYGAMTTDGVLDAEMFWNTYYALLSAFRTSIDSILGDMHMDDKKRVGMLKDSVSEVSDKLTELFDTYPITKSVEDENDEIYEKMEKTVDVLTELDTLILSGEISVDEVSDILEGLEMADKTVETVETLITAIAAKDAEIAKAVADVTALKAEIETLKTQTVEKKEVETVDIWKGVNPEIKAQFEALQKSADESQKIAKAAEENAAMIRLTKRVSDELGGIAGTADEKATLLRDVEKVLPADKFEKLYTTLKDASSVIAKSALLEEKGRTGTVGTTNGAFAKLQAKAAELVTKGTAKTEAQGIELAAKLNPELYAEYMTEGTN